MAFFFFCCCHGINVLKPENTKNGKAPLADIFFQKLFSINSRVPKWPLLTPKPSSQTRPAKTMKKAWKMTIFQTLRNLEKIAKKTQKNRKFFENFRKSQKTAKKNPEFFFPKMLLRPLFKPKYLPNDRPCRGPKTPAAQESSPPFFKNWNEIVIDDFWKIPPYFPIFRKKWKKKVKKMGNFPKKVPNFWP